MFPNVLILDNLINMKILLTLFILLFSSSVIAEDISKFEIEGISIGDSLLDYMTEEEILKDFEITSKHYYYLNNTTKFGEAYIFNGENFKTYKNLSFFVKRDDKKYKIFMIRGMLSYIEDLEGCLKKQKEVSNEVEKIITNYEKIERNAKSKNDPSGKSKYYYIKYNFENGDNITIHCSDWDEKLRKKNNWTEGISVKIGTHEFNEWMTDY